MADADNRAVLDGDDGSAPIGKDLSCRQPAALCACHLRGDAAGRWGVARMFRGGGTRRCSEVLGFVDRPVAGVVARLDREMAVGQLGYGVDQRRRHSTQQLGPQQHRLDVGRRVVVGEDRPREILRGAGGGEVARCREDRVGGVVGVGAPGRGGVDAVALPGARQELHPADCARRGGREVLPVVGLDLVDRGEDFPWHPVGSARRLVDRQQERRDVEVLHEELGHLGSDRRRQQRVEHRSGEHAGQRIRVREQARGGGGLGTVLRSAATADQRRSARRLGGDRRHDGDCVGVRRARGAGRGAGSRRAGRAGCRGGGSRTGCRARIGCAGGPGRAGAAAGVGRPGLAAVSGGARDAAGETGEAAGAGCVRYVRAPGGADVGG